MGQRQRSTSSGGTGNGRSSGAPPGAHPPMEEVAHRRANSYWERSMRPLPVLVFLLPLIVLYEIGSVVFLGGGSAQAETIRAHRLLAEVFELFGMSSLYLPGVLLVVVLLLWQVLTGDPWKVRREVLGGMLVESIAWTIPLLVLSQIASEILGVGRPAVGGGADGGLVGALVAPAVSEGSRGREMTISVGAGVYEELLFRMVGIALLHLILVDLLRMPHRVGVLLAVVIQAVAFALYHDVWTPTGLSWSDACYFFLAGLYFGGLYVLRGFGIVVAVHALFDVAVLVIW